MSGSDSSQLRDPDDWFAESGWAGEPSSTQGGTAADDLAPRPARRAPLSDLTVTLRTLVVAAAIVVAVIVVTVLAVAGVFSGSGHRHTTTSAVPPATTSNTPTTPTTTAVRPRPTLAPTTTLKPGDTGAQVKRLQRALAKLGESPGSVDGDYGPSTVAAVKRFQQAKQLTADGIVGPATLRALKQALAAS